MANQTTFTTVTDGDQLSEGYFNEIGEFYAEHTDTSVSNYATANDSATELTKKVTFTYPSLSTNYILKRIEFEDLSLTHGGTFLNGGESGYVGVIITEGTNYWTVSGGSHWAFNNSNNPATPPHIDVTSSGTPASFLQIRSGTTTIDAFSVNIPMNLITGATSLDVEVYLGKYDDGGSGASQATLNKGFTIRLVFSKRARSLGITPTQA